MAKLIAKHPKHLRYGDLPETPPVGVMLWCAWCVEQFSASRGDYFTRRDDEIIRCGECHQTHVRLVEKRVRYVRWRKPEATQKPKATQKAFATRNLGDPFDRATASAVLRDLEAAGLIEKASTS